jgi:hypothetical protein
MNALSPHIGIGDALYLCLFLDDIQWADEQGSEELMYAFLKERDLKSVMLILEHRDEESVHLVGNVLPCLVDAISNRHCTPSI